jgi:hypothetical protein
VRVSRFIPRQLLSRIGLYARAGEA